ncbi:molybdenum cofactor guanylyltransferase [Bacillus sp. M6-12]|uniref:molybdenum cofactor guanylyltransferase n=1 Tax=Bacillus sp. M6-12 TaxID=2054166 RepID=UPI000C765913|nr:molybdenum cofactor guanylyltransferase [Bacillus sp. M6-12]PLS18402.1 molybdenum cofactor guanylyltransferase [Bacillus sp. M6-12]
MNTTALLLAGGKSSRMGKNKAMLPMFGQPNVCNIKDELTKAADEVVLITNTPEKYGFLNITVTVDIYKDMGPLGGLHAGLTASQTDVNVITACDMPFIKADIIMRMISFAEGYDAVVPEIFGQLHPLFAVYRKSCLPALEECLLDRKLRMAAFIDKLHVKILKETDFKEYFQNETLFSYMFYNMNKPEDYSRALEIEAMLLAKKGGEEQ